MSLDQQKFLSFDTENRPACNDNAFLKISNPVMMFDPGPNQELSTYFLISAPAWITANFRLAGNFLF